MDYQQLLNDSSHFLQMNRPTSQTNNQFLTTDKALQLQKRMSEQLKKLPSQSSVLDRLDDIASEIIQNKHDLDANQSYVQLTDNASVQVARWSVYNKADGEKAVIPQSPSRQVQKHSPLSQQQQTKYAQAQANLNFLQQELGNMQLNLRDNMNVDDLDLIDDELSSSVSQSLVDQIRAKMEKGISLQPVSKQSSGTSQRQSLHNKDKQKQKYNQQQLVAVDDEYRPSINPFQRVQSPNLGTSVQNPLVGFNSFNSSAASNTNASNSSNIFGSRSGSFLSSLIRSVPLVNAFQGLKDKTSCADTEILEMDDEDAKQYLINMINLSLLMDNHQVEVAMVPLSAKITSLERLLARTNESVAQMKSRYEERLAEKDEIIEQLKARISMLQK